MHLLIRTGGNSRTAKLKRVFRTQAVAVFITVDLCGPKLKRAQNAAPNPQHQKRRTTICHSVVASLRGGAYRQRCLWWRCCRRRPVDRLRDHQHWPLCAGWGARQRRPVQCANRKPSNRKISHGCSRLSRGTLLTCSRQYAYTRGTVACSQTSHFCWAVRKKTNQHHGWLPRVKVDNKKIENCAFLSLIW